MRPPDVDPRAGTRRYTFADKESFLAKLKELRASGVEARRITALTPYPVHEAEPHLEVATSPLRFFTLAGSLAGLAAGFALPILTVLDWPLITGGKPLISLPAFLIVAFELTILLGAGASFAGFLLLTRLPSPVDILELEETGNDFVLLLEDPP